MDSIVALNLKGYDKVNPLEHHSSSSYHHKTTQKRRRAIVIFLTILLTLIIVALIGALIHESITEQPEPPTSIPSNSADSLKTVCSVTQYPDSCFTSLSFILDSNSPSKIDPELVFNFSLQVAIKELTNLTSLPDSLISKSSDPRTVSALQDCLGMFNDAVSQINTSLSSIEVSSGHKVLTETKINDMKTWISAAMTDQGTCFDGLEEMGSTVIDEVRAKVQKSTEYMSNSLAILTNMDSLFQKLGLTMH